MGTFQFQNHFCLNKAQSYSSYLHFRIVSISLLILQGSGWEFGKFQEKKKFEFWNQSIINIVSFIKLKNCWLARSIIFRKIVSFFNYYKKPDPFFLSSELPVLIRNKLLGNTLRIFLWIKSLFVQKGQRCFAFHIHSQGTNKTLFQRLEVHLFIFQGNFNYKNERS